MVNKISGDRLSMSVHLGTSSQNDGITNE